MSDSVDVWDLLWVNGSIDTGTWVLLKFIIPVVIIAVIFIGIPLLLDGLGWIADRWKAHKKKVKK